MNPVTLTPEQDAALDRGESITVREPTPKIDSWRDGVCYRSEHPGERNTWIWPSSDTGLCERHESPYPPEGERVETIVQYEAALDARTGLGPTLQLVSLGVEEEPDHCIECGLVACSCGSELETCQRCGGSGTDPDEPDYTIDRDCLSCGGIGEHEIELFQSSHNEYHEAGMAIPWYFTATLERIET